MIAIVCLLPTLIISAEACESDHVMSCQCHLSLTSHTRLAPHNMKLGIIYLLFVLIYTADAQDDGEEGGDIIFNY